MEPVQDQTAFAERLLEVIDSGRRTATYKLALLLALIDLAARNSDENGDAPAALHTRDIAEAMLAIYWEQALPFPIPGVADPSPLRQIALPRGTITEAANTLRAATSAAGLRTLTAARVALQDLYDAALDRVEVALCEQPLPRLQTIGTSETQFPFLYDLDWEPRQHFSVAKLRKHGERGPLVTFLPGAGDNLVRLAPLIRPLIELHWVRMVASFNGIARKEEELRRHLFGRNRLHFPKQLVEGLRELQENACGYCLKTLPTAIELDHFIPWSRAGSDAVENLVATDGPCNRDKADLLAAPDHVTSWRTRNMTRASDLEAAAAAAKWVSAPDDALAVARSTYSHLPNELRPFWGGVKLIVYADPATAVEALAK